MSDPIKKTKLEEDELSNKRIMIQFSTSESSPLVPLDVPISSSPQDLHNILNNLLNLDPPQPFVFQHNSQQITCNLSMFINKLHNFNTEHTLSITYHPQSLYFIKPITRWSSSLEGHEDAVLCSCFTPDSRRCATGSGDKTIRFWDLETETPVQKIEAMKGWVLSVQIRSDGRYMISGDSEGFVGLFQIQNLDQQEVETIKVAKGHKGFVSSLAWEPFLGDRFLSAGKDAVVKMWNLSLTCERVFTSHTAAVTKVLWGGQGFIFTSSEDRIIKVWKESGSFIRDLKGHGHWVNTMALHTDFALKTGCFELGKAEKISKEIAKQRYQNLLGKGNERLVSGSDDFSLIMWDPVKNAKPLYRMTGHQAPVNHVCYSPDGKFIISGAFDKALKLWDGTNGTFISNFRGHVGSIYQVAWSADSRLCISGSKDSTLKVWDAKTKKQMFDLPGHSDEIYTVEWSPDGNKVISGGKDKLVKIWKN